MSKKQGKTVYLPVWIAEILDNEAIKGGGPGVVAAASILEFSTKKPKEKANIIKRFRDKEISISYSDSGLDPEKVTAEIEESAADYAKSQERPDKKPVRREQA